MICKRCGEINAESAKFCSACGALLISEEQVVRNREEALRYFSEEPAFDRSQAKSPDEYFFEPKAYGEEEPYSHGTVYAYQNERAVSRPRQRSNAPYIITSLFTALLAAFQFFLPFAQWVSFQYSMLGQNLFRGEFSLIEIVRRFMEKDNIFTFFVGNDNDYGISGFLPESINGKYALGRIGAMIIGGIFALSLLLFFIFILLAVFRSRAAVGMGISASIVMILANAAFLFAVDRFLQLIDKIDVMQFKILSVTLKPTPYLSIGLSVAIIVMCIVFAALDRRRR